MILITLKRTILFLTRTVSKDTTFEYIIMSFQPSEVKPQTKKTITCNQGYHLLQLGDAVIGTIKYRHQFISPIPPHLYGKLFFKYLPRLDTHRQVITWIFKDLLLTLDANEQMRLYEDVMSCFCRACGEGNLERVKFLSQLMKMDVEDIRFLRNWALVDSCANGHLDIVKFLLDNYPLTYDDITINNKQAFHQSSQLKNQTTYQYICQRFQTTKDD